MNGSSKGSHNGRNVPVIFIFKNAHDQDQTFPGKAAFQSFSQTARGCGVVGAVHEKERFLFQTSEPAEPSDAGKTTPDGILRNRIALLFQPCDHLQSHCGIDRLMSPGQRNRQILVFLIGNALSQVILPQDLNIRSIYHVKGTSIPGGLVF